MIWPRRRLVAAASVLLVLEAVVFALFVTESVTDAVAAVAFTCVSLWVHVVLHECGHLVVAKLLRLPVVAIHIAPFTGWRNAVWVRPSPSATALPPRMVLFHLGGPMTNLFTATVLGIAMAAADTALTRVALLGAALAAAVIGVVNLVPATSPRSDGRNLLRWLRAPAATRAALRAGYYQEEVGRALRPHMLSARVAMGLAHLLDERPEHARSLLLDVRPVPTHRTCAASRFSCEPSPSVTSATAPTRTSYSAATTRN